ncbi:MAG: nucleotidyltransferase domain-containing protein, partial [Firmicutes bacterium]|nr:nucleotidyltransferase domain-containing protein [Bacillota bacterium]
VISLREKLRENVVKLPTPTYENLKGWYEECWCNYRNKMLVSVAAENAIQVFLVALGAQNYFDEMTANLGTKQCNLMQYFDANDLEKILNEFLRIMDEYLHEYEKVGRKPKIYNSFEELYRDFMGLVT